MNRSQQVLLTLIFAFVISACNTTRGIGQDIEAVGEAVEEAAEETSDALD